jgi:hypothetical protein
MNMPKRTPQDWETLERELHAAGVSPGEDRTVRLPVADTAPSAAAQ